VQWSDIQFSPSDRTLRQFAGIFLVVFGTLAVVEATLRHRPQLALVYGVLALVVGSLGLIWPRAIRPVFVAWSVVAFPIGWLVSTVTLGVLFYGLFTPIGLVFRAFGRDLLARRRTPNVQSYWRPKPAARTSREYFRQS
jgi:drug/metabolite transporter (DMT)-like permease